MEATITRDNRMEAIVTLAAVLLMAIAAIVASVPKTTTTATSTTMEWTSDTSWVKGW